MMPKLNSRPYQERTMQRIRTVTLAPDVLDVLRRSVVTNTSVRLPEQLDRGLYVRVDKALRAAGGRWDRKAGVHVFDVDPRQTLTLDAGEVVHRQQTLQRFDTPDAIADRLVELAEVEPPHRCLEPSVGGGSILRALERAGCRDVVAIDIDELAIDALLRDPERPLRRRVLVTADFLEWSVRTPPRRFDRVVMNPPFTGGQDAAHVCHAFDLLAPGGVVVAIVAPMSLRKSTRPFMRLQALVRAQGDLQDTLPRGTFADTDIETLVIRLRART